MPSCYGFQQYYPMSRDTCVYYALRYGTGTILLMGKSYIERGVARWRMPHRRDEKGGDTGEE